MSAWFWELRGEGEWLPPEITSIGEGWVEWDGPLRQGPPKSTEIFARELIQNFVDAARDVPEADRRENTPRLSFHFVELSGKSAKKLAADLGLQGHSDRYKSMPKSERDSLRLGESSLLEGDFSTIRALVVVEKATSGMYGPWTISSELNVVRKMRSALLSVVGDRRLNGLGAYGEGKRAVIAASRPRIVLTYTCFDEREDTPGVSRRFLGTTYWRPFSDGTEAATGLAMLGRQTDSSDRGINGRPIPLENQDADAFIKDLEIPFFEVRNPKAVSQRGTTQVFLDPTVLPAELSRAIARNWWPLIEIGAAHFEVFDYDGSQIEVVPEDDDALAPFIQTFRTLRGENPPRSLATYREDISTISSSAIASNMEIGKLALAASIGDGGWSWKDRDTNRSIVALVRDGMIIEYEPFPRQRSAQPPFIRGVFFVDSSSNKEAADAIRLSEPPLHNFWREDPANGRQTAMLATSVYQGIQDQVRRFKHQFQEVQPPNDMEFALFAEVFNVPDEITITPPPSPPSTSPKPTMDPWSNQSISANLKVGEESRSNLIATASRELSLKPESELDEIEVEIEVGWEVLEEGRWSKIPEMNTVGINVPKRFTSVDQRLIGFLTKESVVVEWQSNEYPGLWTVRPYALIATRSQA